MSKRILYHISAPRACRSQYWEHSFHISKGDLGTKTAAFWDALDEAARVAFVHYAVKVAKSDDLSDAYVDFLRAATDEIAEDTDCGSRTSDTKRGTDKEPVDEEEAVDAGPLVDSTAFQECGTKEATMTSLNTSTTDVTYPAYRSAQEESGAGGDPQRVFSLWGEHDTSAKPVLREAFLSTLPAPRTQR